MTKGERYFWDTWGWLSSPVPSDHWDNLAQEYKDYWDAQALKAEEDLEQRDETGGPEE